MRIATATQGSAEWLERRTGLVTASRIKDVMAVLKNGGESAVRANYRNELVSERLTGRAAEHYVSPEMDHGTEYEPFARAAYEIGTETMVDRVGLVLHPRFDFAACSPDGLVGTYGLIEIKAPKTTTHLKWMQAGTVPEEHQAQMLWGMICCERSWADFVSFDPRLPEGLRLFIVRMELDTEAALATESAVVRFNEEIEGITSKLRERIVVPPPVRPTTWEEVADMIMEIIP